MSAFTLSRGPSRDDKQRFFETGDPDTFFADLQEIGHGSFGAVYCAIDQRSASPAKGQNVAIKKMSYAGRSAEKFNEILKEVKLLRSVRHRNVVEFQGCYLKEKEHTAWIVMEYCLGSASDLVEVQPGKLSEMEISQIIRNVLQGLEYLHGISIIHRDVKAGNILLTDHGLAKLGDFGSASAKCPANSFVGSPYWMAPEVILAMENGLYDGAADIWSLGITSIEIADKKPPLFSQNAMAALYQIAQADPPKLIQTEWSAPFHQFVSGLLKKTPSERLNASEALEHKWLKDNRENPSQLIELIRRTKRMVEEQESEKYKRMIRILQGGDGPATADLGGSVGSRSSASVHDDGESDSDLELSSQESGSNHGSLQRNNPNQSTNESLNQSTTSSDQSHLSSTNQSYRYHDASTAQYESSSSSHQLPEYSTRPPTIRINRSKQSSSAESSSSAAATPRSSTDAGSGRQRAVQNFQPAIGSGFATIRPVTLLKKQQEEQVKVSAFREQMGNYKKLRQDHRRIMLQLETKLEGEMESHQKKLQSELGNMRRKHHDDREKAAKKRLLLIEKIQRDDETEEKVFEKYLDQKAESERREIEEQQKAEMKQQKHRWNSGAALPGITKEQQKMQLARHHSEQKQKLEVEQRQSHEMELRKYKRKRLTARHNEEQKMLEEELAERLQRNDEENRLMKYHHDMTRQLEYKHMQTIHEMRLNHQQIQHTMEIDAQKEHMRQQEQELRRKHQTAMKQAPKNMKEKEAMIKKQFQENVKVQEKQYKAFKNHVLEKTQKREQKTVIKRMKTERKRKMALLWEQYEKTISDLHQDNTSRLNETQKAEEQNLRLRLEQDLKLLQDYQAKRRQQVIEMNKEEEKALDGKVSMRLGLILQREDKGRRDHADERAAKIRNLSDRQAREIEEFDAESLRLGFNTVVIDSRSGNYYLISPPERDSPVSHENQSADRRLMPPDEVRRVTNRQTPSSSRHKPNGTSFYR